MSELYYANPQTCRNGIKCNGKPVPPKIMGKWPKELPEKQNGNGSSYYDVRVEENLNLNQNVETIKAGFISDFDFNSIIGESNLIAQTRKIAKRFAPSEVNILLSGESGTGKELMFAIMS